MDYLAVATVVALVSTAFNLLLTFGVIRKLREHDTRLAPPPVPDSGPPTGSTIAPLTATTVAGRQVSTVDADRATLVGFFTPGCKPCADSIPEFLDRHARTGVAAVAVVVTDVAGSGLYAERLAEVDVLIEPGGGSWATAFRVSSFPTLCLIDRGGVVLGSGNAFTDLPMLTAA
ncbi:TlpA family protein disulfide reductase [Dactylosporangium sp. NPDC000521]|uniref:TlpA family protein disulfide reductase n=1 Tax=Dactylosporangium sp. NPDC000521 TaxID=3363975 RepID=UPI00368AD027